MISNLVALVDCNNFYVSCERIFNPQLRNKPVVVLSNNDGCVIARSNEAKALGIPMGAPAFKYRDTFRYHNVQVISSNFELYGDISARVMNVLAQLAEEMEIYSIDEAFLDFSAIAHQEVDIFAHHIRAQVKKLTGIPISIGIAPTKTLAKIANKVAKKNAAYNGVCNIARVRDIDVLLDSLDVGDVWGVGRRYAKMLHAYGIKTIKQLKYAPDAWVQKQMTILGLRTVWELRGSACIALEDMHEMNKSIVCSRTFGQRVTTLSDVQEAVATFASRAAEKLQEQKACSSLVHVYIMTSLFQENNQRYGNSFSSYLPVPTSYTPDIIHHALVGVKKIYQSGYEYKKAGVVLLDIVSEKQVQMSILQLSDNNDKKYAAMKVFDSINAKWHRGVTFAATGVNHQRWRAQRARRSPRFTTCWDELLVVKN